MNKPQATILIIVGITGDLSSRKLLPAIEQIVKAKVAPDCFRLVGITRRDVSSEEVISKLDASVSHDFLSNNLEMYQMDLTNPSDYGRLEDYLKTIEKEMGCAAERLFYLSVPPQISRPIVELLGNSGIANAQGTKLLLEKPFGTDLISAQELIEETKKHFQENQVYRIDHYLAKEMAQNFIVFRSGNSLFKRTWDNRFIEKIEIIASEKIGIEGRAAFYEQTGALRDVVQGHLLQLTALALMQTPRSQDWHDVPKLRLEALRQIYIPDDQPIHYYAKRGQYEGYKDEVTNNHSNVETYTDITLFSKDPRWTGVPIRIVTGKKLHEKLTEIKVTYKKDEDYESNELIIKLQPSEAVKLCLWTKVPGYEWNVENHSLELAFKDHFATLPEAYERVFLDAINSTHRLFTSSEEVIESWRIIKPIQKAWSMSAQDLVVYPCGSKPTEIAR